METAAAVVAETADSAEAVVTVSAAAISSCSPCLSRYAKLSRLKMLGGVTIVTVDLGCRGAAAQDTAGMLLVEVLTSVEP